MSRLDDLMKDINKKYGENTISEGQIEVKYEKIPFTAPRLNYMTYGGLVEGRFHMFAGTEGSGKTLTALDVCKNAMLKYPDKKVFYADLEHTLDPVWGLKNGVDIGDFVTNKAKVKILKIDEEKNISRLQITIHEGKNRQIRRMCEAIGKKVLSLHRSKIGGISVKDLKIGTWRYLNKSEIENLLK